jgi:hypothetical protein
MAGDPTDRRYERVDGRIVAVAPERGAHLRVKGAVYRALDRAVTLAGVPCQALPEDPPGIVIAAEDIYTA